MGQKMDLKKKGGKFGATHSLRNYTEGLPANEGRVLRAHTVLISAMGRMSIGTNGKPNQY